MNVIWSSKNTKEIKEIIEKAKFEKAFEDLTIMQNHFGKGKLLIVEKSLTLYSESYRNPLLEGEIVVGILLRVYNNNPMKKLPFDNQSFLKSLLDRTQQSFNEYCVLDTFIQRNTQKQDNEEEKNLFESEYYQGAQYYSVLNIDESKFEHLNSELIDEYKIT